MSYFASLMMKIGVDAKDMQVGLRKAEGEVSRFSRRLSGDFKAVAAGFFSYEAFKATIGAVVETATKLKDLSEQYQMTTDQIQLIDKAAKGSGLVFEDLAGGISRLDAVMGKALEDQKLLDIFNKVGISISDIQKALDTGDKFPIFEALAKGAKDLNNAELMDIFGKSGGKMRAALEDMVKISQGFKPPISNEDIENIDKASKLWDKFKGKFARATAPFIGMSAESGMDVLDGKNILKHLFNIIPGAAIPDIAKKYSDRKTETREEQKSPEITARGPIVEYSKKTTDEITKQEEKLAETRAKNALIGKTDTFRINELQKTIGGIYDKIMMLGFLPEDEIKRLELQNQVAEKEGEIKTIRAGMKTDPNADALARIGGLGSSLGLAGIENYQKQTAENLRLINTKGIKIQGGE